MDTIVSAEEQKIINTLQANWTWPDQWTDAAPSTTNTAGRLVHFLRTFDLPPSTSPPSLRAQLHFIADTRYKLYVNGARVAVGPARSSPQNCWYYDALDVAPYLKPGSRNVVEFVVVRYFAATRAAMPFARTLFPGFTVVGGVEDGEGPEGRSLVDLRSGEGGEWKAWVEEGVLFPVGLPDDVFLHISERGYPTSTDSEVTWVKLKPYNMRTLNGDIAPWRLRPRVIPMPEENTISVGTIRKCQSPLPMEHWTACLSENKPLLLPADSSHTLEVQAEVHSTAFLRWVFNVAGEASSKVRLKVTYSEGYEHEPRNYPFFRTKTDRLDAENGHLIGPFDDVTVNMPGKKGDEETGTSYEPFWFRTFRIMRWEITVGASPVEFKSFGATQINYPMDVKASWKEPGNTISDKMWEVSIRTMRNCMFDGYSDCPFYEQLQYAGDSRTVGLFHYLLSGDDRLMRQTISNFAASVTPDGLTQSRFPSHVQQLIAGFSLYWILQVCDHHLYFGPSSGGYARSLLPRVDGVLDFFDRHVDERGLVGGLPEDVWQYVDWVTGWAATDEHPDKGVPTSGRQTNRHTYFSMLYVYTLKQAARLVRDVGRPGYAAEYEERARLVSEAVREHCYDGEFFTDSTVDVAEGEDAYSQHCQVWAVLSGIVSSADEAARILRSAFSLPDKGSSNNAQTVTTKRNFFKCSYMMRFYAFRALALAGDDVYEDFWPHAWTSYHRMLLEHNLTTWEEDDVRQRSDCHAWGSVPIYEFCVEVAGIQPLKPGAARILFRPRLRLSDAIEARVALGRDNAANVSWTTMTTGEGERKEVKLVLDRPVDVVSELPGGKRVEHGVVDSLTFVWTA